MVAARNIIVSVVEIEEGPGDRIYHLLCIIVDDIESVVPGRRCMNIFYEEAES